MHRCCNRRPACSRRPVRRRSSRSTMTGSRSVQTSFHFSPHQDWSGGIARVSASGKPSIALRRGAVGIDLECMRKGRLGDLVDDDRRWEGRVATRRFNMWRFVPPVRGGAILM